MSSARAVRVIGSIAGSAGTIAGEAWERAVPAPFDRSMRAIAEFVQHGGRAAGAATSGAADRVGDKSQGGNG